MPSFNRLTIVGHLGRDPELKYTPQGTAVANFSIATTEKRKGNGETTETTTWFRVTVFGKQAEIAQQYLGKGKLVYVEGRLKLNEYTDRDGNRRSSLEVTADNFQMLGGNPSGAAEDGDSRQKQNAAAFAAQAPSQRGIQGRPPMADYNEQVGPDDSEIPF